MKTFWIVGGIAAATALQAFGSGTTSGEVLETYVERGMTARYLVPTDGSVDAVWTDPGFDDAAWAEGPIGMGFDAHRYHPYFLTDLRNEMLSQGSGIYIRIEFDIEDLPEAGTPAFCARLDDALVAYLNGVEIVRTDLAPSETNWESRSTGNIIEDGFEEGEEFSSDSWRPLLQPGKNVLALHGLNSSPTSIDFLIDPTFQIQQIPPKFTKVAEHPLVGMFGTRGLLGLKGFDGKLYMGYGEWDDHPGPTILYSYNPSDGIVRAEHSLNTDSIERMYEIGGRLWIPSVDPIHFNRFTDLSIVHPDGHLEQRTPVGFFHVFDVLERMNGDVLLVGSKDSNEWPQRGGAVFRSGDGGESWEDFRPAEGASRFYTAREGQAGELLLGTSSSHVERGVAVGQGGEVRVEVYGSTFRRLTSNAIDQERAALDLAVEGSAIYLLDTVGGVIHSPDITVADPIWETLGVSLPAGARFIEVVDSTLFVGTGGGELWARPGLGEDALGAATYSHTLPERCGAALALHGDTLVVGAPNATGVEVQSGKVYCYERAGDGAGWQQTAEMFAPGENLGGLFGDSVAIEGDSLVVLESGVWAGSDRGQGAIIHTYERGGGGVFQLVGSATKRFAQSVALGGGHLFYTAKSDLFGQRLADGVSVHSSAISGAGYEPFGRVAMAPRADGSWTVVQGASGDVSREGARGFAYTGTLQPDPPASFVAEGQIGSFTRFQRSGFSVAAGDGIAAIGAPRNDTAAIQAGAVYVYREAEEGTPFVFEQVLFAPFPEAEDDFGHAVALSPEGDRLLVGAPLARGPGGRRGAVFLFENDGVSWAFRSVYFPPADDLHRWEYGISVLFDGDTGIVGSGFADETRPGLDRLDFIDLTAPAQSIYSLWAGARGLAAPDDDPGADPDGDGATNLEAFAFDLPGGGLRVAHEGETPHLVLHRRADSERAGLTYRIEISAELGAWQEFEVDDLDAERTGQWERIELPLPEGMNFARGVVEIVP